MNHQTNIGLIECETLEKSFVERSASLPRNLNVKKAFAFHESCKSALCKRFPEMELTADCEDILQDQAIGLVLISALSDKHRSLISAALKANKQVQIV
jgi:predicted dehydrogenase